MIKVDGTCLLQGMDNAVLMVCATCLLRGMDNAVLMVYEYVPATGGLQRCVDGVWYVPAIYNAVLVVYGRACYSMDNAVLRCMVRACYGDHNAVLVVDGSLGDGHVQMVPWGWTTLC